MLQALNRPSLHRQLPKNSPASVVQSFWQSGPGWVDTPEIYSTNAWPQPPIEIVFFTCSQLFNAAPLKKSTL